MLMQITFGAALGGFEGSAGAGLELLGCSGAPALLGAGAAGRPPGTNSAAVGLRAPLLRADFREGACTDPAMLKLITQSVNALQQALFARHANLLMCSKSAAVRPAQMLPGFF